MSAKENPTHNICEWDNHFIVDSSLHRPPVYFQNNPDRFELLSQNYVPKTH